MCSTLCYDIDPHETLKLLCGPQNATRAASDEEFSHIHERVLLTLHQADRKLAGVLERRGNCSVSLPGRFAAVHFARTQVQTLHKTCVCPGRPKWTYQVYCCKNGGCGSVVQPMLVELRTQRLFLKRKWFFSSSRNYSYSRNPPIYYRLYNIHPPTPQPPSLSPDNINPAQATTSYFPKISFIIIAPPTFRSSKRSLAFTFPNQNHGYFSIPLRPPIK